MKIYEAASKQLAVPVFTYLLIHLTLARRLCLQLALQISK